MKRVEHEAVAAERHENLGLVDLCKDEAALQERFGRLCDVGVRGQQADPARRQVDGRLLLGVSSRSTAAPLPFNDPPKIGGTPREVTVPFRSAAESGISGPRAAR